MHCHTLLFLINLALRLKYNMHENHNKFLLETLLFPTVSNVTSIRFASLSPYTGLSTRPRDKLRMDDRKQPLVISQGKKTQPTEIPGGMELTDRCTARAQETYYRKWYFIMERTSLNFPQERNENVLGRGKKKA